MKNMRLWVTDSGDIGIACYCLKTDSWLDYIAFKEDARAAFARQDVRGYARFLRAALLSLFGHMQAVLNEVCDRVGKPTLNKHDQLCHKIKKIVNEAKKIVEVPPLDFHSEKILRDMLAHPGIEILNEGDGVIGEEVDGITYERLDFQTLERFEAQLSPWIDSICAAFAVTRLEDMEAGYNLVAGLAGGPCKQGAMPGGGPI
jgi:hypothetical protein